MYNCFFRNIDMIVKTLSTNQTVDRSLSLSGLPCPIRVSTNYMAFELERSTPRSFCWRAVIDTWLLISGIKAASLFSVPFFRNTIFIKKQIQSYFQTQGDYHILHNVARILELVVPLMEHPRETFLASLEEDLTRLSVKHGQTVSL